ncbi:MAG: hypothetical protein KAR07_01600 [Spirochaetes bacterium]|nr:hypothetical protein [Spirochaetota bacterium]MCK5266837.1 hypothetical protein [Spirochaetota bacterium]
MKSKVSMLGISKIINDEFNEFDSDRIPGEKFKKTISVMMELEDEIIIDIVKGVLLRINEYINIKYITMILDSMAKYFKNNMLFFIDDLNTMLEILFSIKDIKRALILLEIIGEMGDSRTSSIIKYYTEHIQNNKTTSNLIRIRCKIDKRLRYYLKRLNAAEIHNNVSYKTNWRDELK